MNALCHVVVVSLLSLFLVVSTEARTVYLKDGAVLQAEAAWRAGGKVVVLVNHEEELTFPEGEVNLRRTFPKQITSPSRLKQSASPPVMRGISSARSTASGVKAPAGIASPAAPAKNGAPTPAPAQATTGPSVTVAPPNPPGTASAPPVAVSVPPPPAPQPSSTNTPPKKHPIPGAVTPSKNIPETLPNKFAAVPMAMIISIMLGAFLLAVLMIVSLWKVYVKAGQAGWKSLVPIYNMVVLLNIIDKPVWWVILLFVPLVQIFITFAIYIELARRFGKGVLFGVGLVIIPIVFFPLLAFGDAAYD